MVNNSVDNRRKEEATVAVVGTVLPRLVRILFTFTTLLYSTLRRRSPNVPFRGLNLLRVPY